MTYRSYLFYAFKYNQCVEKDICDSVVIYVLHNNSMVHSLDDTMVCTLIYGQDVEGLNQSGVFLFSTSLYKIEWYFFKGQQSQGLTIRAAVKVFFCVESLI